MLDALSRFMHVYACVVYPALFLIVKVVFAFIFSYLRCNNTLMKILLFIGHFAKIYR